MALTLLWNPVRMRRLRIEAWLWRQGRGNCYPVGGTRRKNRKSRESQRCRGVRALR